ncbi:hypothetical protein CWO91_13595 [Bradyrhizobium genosp. SA-3]|uniref:AMP-binding protein n=1 Tax=Bradyrhizobium genosp. SA-3 TaxID=508868 RepID=UPI00102A8225|nr:AMP-binding protein [Bradyrhizobium genosp. SA-3]RZN10350.1 hypothetical protein CWO91_13595 [Bradyrhizobium genosp. SA-3]
MMNQRTLLEMVKDGVGVDDGDPILTFVDIGAEGGLVETRRSYRELLSTAQLLAGALNDAGTREGDAFAIIMRNEPEFVEAMIASEIAGTVFVPVDPRTRGERLAYMLRFSGCNGAIVSPEIAPHILDLASDLPDLRWIWTIGAEAPPGLCRSLQSILSGATPTGELEPRPLDAPMQMLFTSGTTGHPKAILAPHGRFAFAAGVSEFMGYRSGDRLYTGLSLTHANAQFITLGNSLRAKLPCVFSKQFTKSRLWEILAHCGCTTFNLLGGMTAAIFAEPPDRFDRAHKVRFVLSAGMPASMWQAFEERFGADIFEFFGTAEGGLTLNPPGTGPVGSIGKALPGTVCEILDEAMQTVPAGELGEICFRNADGTVSPVNYFGAKEASEQKTRGGWFHSGDMGWKDEAGWLYFSHRAGYSIRRNGDFIDPRAIETVLATMLDVDDVYVYGVATATNAPGEKEVIAAVVSRRGLGDTARIFSECNERLGKSSVPGFLQIVSEIPKTASEKPLDRHLVEMIAKGDCTVFDRNGKAMVELKVERVR